MPDPYPTDFSDVVSGGNITASRNNAITKKIGLTAINTDDAANPTGHLSIPTLAGTPAGTPANGVGSMVWNSSANSLHVNTTGSTWAEIGGGGGSAFTEAVTIAATDNSDPLLIITQSGSAGILQGIGDDTDHGFLFENDGGFQLNTSTESSRNPTHDFGYTNYAGYMNLYGLNNGNSKALRFSITLGQDNHSYMRLTGRNDNGASLFLGDDGGDATDYEYEFGIQSGVAHDATTFSLSGADGIWNTSHAAGGAFNLTRPTTVAISSATTALTVTQSGAGGWIDFVGSMDNSSKDPTSDAPADWVEVQIAGSTYFLPAYAAS